LLFHPAGLKPATAARASLFPSRSDHAQMLLQIILDNESASRHSSNSLKDQA
jgi:hypothetical protein